MLLIYDIYSQKSCHDIEKLAVPQNHTIQMTFRTRMWADAERDGRPAEYRWRPLFNAAKFGWRPLLECGAVTPPRRQTSWSQLGCPKLTNHSQPLVGRSSPYSENMWRRYCCLTSFFRLSLRALVAKIYSPQIYPMVRRWRIFADFLRTVFSANRAKNIMSASATQGGHNQKTWHEIRKKLRSTRNRQTCGPLVFQFPVKVRPKLSPFYF